MQKIQKGDNVEVISGKDRGKRGSVLRVIPSLEKVVVQGVNVVKRHRKARRAGEKGERIEKEAPFHWSNVMIVCPKTDKKSRVGVKVVNGEKVRIAKTSGAQL